MKIEPPTQRKRIAVRWIWIGGILLCFSLALTLWHKAELRKRAEEAKVRTSRLQSLARDARDQFEKGDYLEAENIYRQILAQAPDDLNALCNLGVVLFRAGQFEPAGQVLKKAIAVAPEDGFSHCTLGIVYYSAGKYDEAIGELTSALTIDPGNATAHNYLGITAAQKGWMEVAQKELETATKLDPAYKEF